MDLLSAFSGYRVAVELRHRSWSDAFGDTLTLLNGFEAAWTQIDEPKFSFSIRQNSCPTSGASITCGFTAGTRPMVAPREDGRPVQLPVPAEELKELIGTADAARHMVKKLYLYTNNHFSAKSVANATDDQAATRRTARGRVSAGVRPAVPGACARRRRPWRADHLERPALRCSGVHG